MQNSVKRETEEAEEKTLASLKEDAEKIEEELEDEDEEEEVDEEDGDDQLMTVEDVLQVREGGGIHPIFIYFLIGSLESYVS